MGVHSGKFGVIDGVSTMRNWQIADVMTAKRFYASNTQGGAGRRKGIREWTGSFAQYGAEPLYLPGETFDFAGYTAPDNDTLAGVGTVYEGTVMVDNIAITWDWRNGELLSMVTNFSGDGVLTITDADTALSDATFPDPPEVAGTKVQMGTNPTYNDVPNLATAVLTLTAENQSYVNSSCYDAGSGHVWTKRKMGNVDWTLALTIDETVRTGTGIPLINGSEEWKLFINATEFWHLKWGRVENWTGINVDIESAAIIGGTVNIGMDGHDGSSAGSIILPDLSTMWP